MTEKPDNVKRPAKVTSLRAARTANSTFTWMSDFCKQPEQSSWLIRGYLELESLAVMFGDSQAGKSFLVIDIACHVAHGMKWRGKRTKQGVVLYIAGEGQHGLKRRFKAWHEYHGVALQENIAVRIVPATLCDPAATGELIEHIKQLLPDLNPVLIIVDTLNRNFGAGDENTTRDMSAFVTGMNALKLATGACVLAVHHVGHGNKERMKGAIALTQGIDSEYRIERDGDPTDMPSLITRMVPTKPKESSYPDPLCWSWNLQSLPWMELDDDDNPVPLNSIVLTPTDYTGPTKTSSAKNLGDTQRKALDVLKRLYDEHRQNLIDSGNHPDSAKVRANDWLTATKEIDSDSGNRSRARQSLIDKKIVLSSDGYVYIA